MHLINIYLAPPWDFWGSGLWTFLSSSNSFEYSSALKPASKNVLLTFGISYLSKKNLQNFYLHASYTVSLRRFLKSKSLLSSFCILSNCSLQNSDKLYVLVDPTSIIPISLMPDKTSWISQKVFCKSTQVMKCRSCIIWQNNGLW